VINLKKISAFILLTIYVLSAVVTKEFLKIPQLVTHYVDHREENAHTSLLSFLIGHYYQEDGTDQDAAEDNKLPFKSAEAAGNFSFVSLAPPVSMNNPVKVHPGLNQQFFNSNDLYIPSQYFDAIWQPPRNA